MQVHEDEGRAGDVGEHPTDRQRARQRVAHEAAVGQQARVDAQDLHGAVPAAVLWRQGLRQRQRHYQRHHRAVAGQHPEYGTPIGPGQQRAAERRRQHRRQPHHQHELRHQADGGRALAHVADHGAGDDHAGASAKPLAEAQPNQPADVLRQRAADRRQDEDREAGQQRRPAPEAVRQRAVGKLRQRHASEERGQRALHRRGLGRQAGGDGGEGRQIHVDGERPEHRHRSEDDDQQDAALRHPAGLSRVLLVAPRTVGHAASGNLGWHGSICGVG